VLIEVVAGLLMVGEIDFDIAKGDFVDIALHGLEMAPEENPTPLIFDARLLWAFRSVWSLQAHMCSVVDVFNCAG
jgi:hypothetical protein